MPTSNRYKRGPRGRRENTRVVKPRFLIVCEDTKSAPNYFRGFRLTSAEVIAVGTGFNCLVLVNEAINLRSERGLLNHKDQTWVVMDRDSFPQDDYDNAFQKAAANDIQIAHSNECLEVWFLLHFRYLTASMGREALPSLVSKHLGIPYSKGMEDLYGRIESQTKRAISNAKKLVTYHTATSNIPIHNCCPSTHIHLLVEEMLNYVR